MATGEVHGGDGDEARVGDSLEHAGDETKAEHSSVGLGAGLRHQEDTPEEDVGGEVLGQREFGEEQVTRNRPDDPADVEDGAEVRVVGALQIEVFLDAEECGVCERRLVDVLLLGGVVEGTELDTYVEQVADSEGWDDEEIQLLLDLMSAVLEQWDVALHQ